MDILEQQALESSDWSRHPWELARLKVVEDQFRRHMPNPSVILDLGCGDLFIANRLARLYPDAEILAVDTAFDDGFIREQNLQSQKTRIATFKDLREVPAGKKVSVVLLLDVIEHIEDDKGFLKMVNSHPAINNDTRVFITVPAYQSLWTHHDVILGHFRRYTNRRLNESIEAGGFRKLHMGYFFTSLILARFGEVLKEKIGLKREKTSVSSWNGSQALSTIIAEIIYGDYKIMDFLRTIGVKMPGLSNYVICQRRA